VRSYDYYYELTSSKRMDGKCVVWTTFYNDWTNFRMNIEFIRNYIQMLAAVFLLMACGVPAVQNGTILPAVDFAHDLGNIW